MTDAAFLDVIANSRSACQCSPEVPEGAIGLYLAAPNRCLLPDDPALPLRLVVCLSIGFSILQHRRVFRRRFGDPVNATTFVLSMPACDIARAGRMYDGRERNVEDETDAPDPSDEMTDAVAAAHTFVDHANPDLGYLMQDPSVPGPCFVHAVLGQLISNVVRVDLVRA